MTIYSLDVLLSQFGTSLFWFQSDSFVSQTPLLFHVQFKLWLPDLHTDFSRGRSGGLVFPSLDEFSPVCCDPHKDFGIVNKADVDVFLELSCFSDDPVDVGNLIF